MDRLRGIQQTVNGELAQGKMAGTRVAPAESVRRILLVNAKGGCGKTTLAINLASYYASNNKHVALFDHDPQGSATQWLSLRDESHGPIHGVAAYRRRESVMTRSFLMRTPTETERVIIDTPAGIHGHQLIDVVRETDTVLVPVLPSPIDIHAAAHFIKDLLLVAKVRSRAIRLGVVANRVKKNTIVYRSLDRFLGTLNIPFVTMLRDTQNYVHAAEQGIGVHELKGNQAVKDRIQWKALIRWLEEGNPTKG
jgi:chromosome partitioning protein